MKIIRSSKCSLGFANERKVVMLRTTLEEYGKVVNFFIKHFWPKPPHKAKLLKPIIDLPDTWLSARLRKVAAREAIDMMRSSVERDGKKAVQPIHKGKRMHVSSTIAELQPAKSASEFDAWLHLQSIGDKVRVTLPVRFHKHFNELAERGKRLESYIITSEYVQFAFEIETGPKRKRGEKLGLDTGIKVLASLSDGTQVGKDIEAHVERIKRCKHGSKGQKRARRALKQRMDEVAKEVFTLLGPIMLLCVEKLSNLNYKSRVRRRLNKTMRKTIGSWAWRYWLDRVQRECEHRRSSFRSVPAYYTSQTCPSCGFVDRRNRNGRLFLCRECGCSGDADITAARNILSRYLTGPYGASFKPKARAS